jgi:hypothetical protein
LHDPIRGLLKSGNVEEKLHCESRVLKTIV